MKKIMKFRLSALIICAIIAVMSIIIFIINPSYRLFIIPIFICSLGTCISMRLILKKGDSYDK